MSLSQKDLDEIEERAKAASEGPWASMQTFPNKTMRSILAGPGTAPDKDPESRLVLGEICGLPRRVERDAEFISHARTDVPLLLAEVRRLRTLVVDLPCMDQGENGEPACDPECVPCSARRALGRT